MNKLTIYVGKTVGSAIFLTILLFIGLELLFSWVNELRYVGTGNYTLWQAAGYILLSLPEQIAEMFPMAALVGTLLGLGTLASRSELIVMRSAGISMTGMIIMVLKLAVILVIITWVLGECVAPFLDKWASQQKAVALSGGQALRTSHGVWMREGDDFIHIQSIVGKDRLQGITRYQFDKAMHLRRTSVAKEAYYQDDHWVLNQLVETIFEEGKIAKRQLDQDIWSTHIQPSLLSVVNTKEIDELSLIGLWKTIRYRHQNALDVKPYQLTFWQKIVRPFATLVMMFFAIPFIFGPLRSATMGLRMLVGIFVGFGFYTINQLFGPLTLVYPLPPILGASLPLFCFLGAGIYLLKRT